MAETCRVPSAMSMSASASRSLLSALVMRNSRGWPLLLQVNTTCVLTFPTKVTLGGLKVKAASSVPEERQCNNGGGGGGGDDDGDDDDDDDETDNKQQLG